MADDHAAGRVCAVDGVCYGMALARWGESREVAVAHDVEGEDVPWVLAGWRTLFAGERMAYWAWVEAE